MFIILFSILIKSNVTTCWSYEHYENKSILNPLINVMDLGCGLMIKITPIHDPFIWNKMLKFKTSKIICNRDM